jgi:adenine-specific DNA-methyltransferase
MSPPSALAPVQLTDYHAKYFAYELTKRCPADSVEKLAGTLVDAQVDLNPHQVDAALFAFRSPLSKGAILADEVGLGKTIEAGLVLSQRWAERKRRILVITPSNLRKQWYQELAEKFFLPCRILESKSYNAAIKQGQFRPFESPDIVICSYQFARSKAGDVHNLPWDLVVIDEAHRLRNVYKPANVIANTLKLALAGKDKLLLTATPLQNSLLELFGLVSFIDEHTFGDLGSFRAQFANLSQEQVFQTLKARLKPVCHRTLRRQVLPYVKYTKRHPIVQPFTPEESEDRLVDLMPLQCRGPRSGRGPLDLCRGRGRRPGSRRGGRRPAAHLAGAGGEAAAFKFRARGFAGYPDSATPGDDPTRHLGAQRALLRGRGRETRRLGRRSEGRARTGNQRP